MRLKKEVVEAARVYVGCPFRHQGRTKQGLDCVGLVIRVALDLGLSQFDYRGYGRDPSAPEFREQLEACQDIRRKEIADAGEGDIIVFALPTYPCHMGFYTGRNVIHALSNIGKVTEHRLSVAWYRRVRFCYAFRGVE